MVAPIVAPPPVSSDMILVWDADINSTATLPLISGGNYLSYEGTTDVTVDWGDGTVESFNTPDYRTHTYSTGGEKTITISGTLTHFGDADFTYGSATYDGLVRVESFGDLGLVNLDSAFIYTPNLTELPTTLAPTINWVSYLLWGSSYNGTDLNNWDTSNVLYMSGVFGADFETSNPFNQDIGSWDVSNVIYMDSMFYFATNFNQNISGWDVSSVQNSGFNWMFTNATSFNQDLSTWCVIGQPDEPSGFWHYPDPETWALSLRPPWGFCGEPEKIITESGSSFFGYAVDISGDTAVVGQYNSTTGTYQGSVHVYVLSAGVWTEQQRLTASDGQDEDYFGQSVAIDGDTIIVGAQFEDGAGYNRGAAYVFTRSGTTWTEQQKLTASDPEDEDYFGVSVAIDGDTVVVGANLEDGAGTNRGAAYVYTRSGTTWTQQQKLTASDGVNNDWFGYSVAIDGDTVVIGSPYSDDTYTNQGAAYVFTRSAGVWSQQQKLTAGTLSHGSDLGSDDYFGTAVAIDGDTIVVGANRDDVIIDSGREGCAYVFARSGTTWTLQSKLTDTMTYKPVPNAYFGQSVAIEGDVVAVGAWGDSSNRGSFSVFTRSGSTWSQQDGPGDTSQRFRSSDAAINDYFGYSIGLSGGRLIVGAYSKNSYTGSAYTYKIQ